MNPDNLTILFSTVLAISWRASWLMLALLVLRRFLRGRIPAQVWFCVWIVLAVRLITPFTVPAHWSPFNLTAPALRIDSSVTAVRTPALATLTQPAMHELIVPDTNSAVAAPAETPAAPRLQAPWWRNSIIWAQLWVAGAFGFLALRAVKLWQFRRELRGAKPVEARIQRLLAVEAAQLQLVAPRCIETSAVDVPALFGAIRPTLLFPNEFAAPFNDEELSLVLRHELAHCRRRDLFTQSLLHVAVAVHWFNPLVWISARLAHSDCELACDESVLGREPWDGATTYGQTLLKVFAMAAPQCRSRPAVGIVDGRQQLAFRMRMIAGATAWRWPRFLFGAGVIALIAVVSATSELRAQQRAAASATEPEISAAPSTVTGTKETPLRHDASPVTEAARARLSDQVAAQQRRVEQTARDLLAYKQENQLTSLDQQSDMLADALRRANTQLQSAQTEVMRLKLRCDQIRDVRQRQGDLTELSFISEQQHVAFLKAAVADAKAHVTELSQRYAERHPTLIEARGKERTLADQLTGAIDSACHRILADRDAAEAALASAQAEVDHRTAEALALDRVAVVIKEKERLLRTQERILDALAARAQEVAMATVPTQYEFKNVVVNLAGTSGTRYLKTTFVVSGHDGGLAAAFDLVRPQLADATQGVLASVTIADIDAPDIRSQLRKKLVSACNKVLGRDLADEVYFSEFVVQ
jgi:beta-lactamase regulating signal transducer with metallopeptidase domain/flagellar basal body-associated protein FliL